jgi:SAM-dependent methyltransferase
MMYHRNNIIIVALTYSNILFVSTSSAFLHSNGRFLKSTSIPKRRQQTNLFHSQNDEEVDGYDTDTGMTESRRNFLVAMTATFTFFSWSNHHYQNVAWATTIDARSGIRLPDVGEIESSIPTDWTDVENPCLDMKEQKSLFSRLDNTPDSQFYQEPRFVEHVDENAVQLMTDYISNVAIQPGDKSVLDLCSSWVSHIDQSTANKLSRISGLGMNPKELEANPVLTDWIVQDLNENPKLTKYDDSTFDVVLCQLSIDYLTKPFDVLKEVGRVLKPNGRVHILFSNRLFFSKAIAGWTGGDDIDHAYTVGCYLHFCDGDFRNIQASDLSTRKGGRDRRIVNDPLFVVSAVKA